jgi:integrase
MRAGSQSRLMLSSPPSVKWRSPSIARRTHPFGFAPTCRNQWYARVRWITPEQVQLLLGELPEHQVEIVLFALATGLRQSNVINLGWSQVDMPRQVAWIHADQAKGRKDIHVSLNSVAMGVLERQLGKHAERVFTYKGKPIQWANTKAWRQALARAGIENFRWHDLRHTWASWHVQNGTPLYVVQEMGGWESEGMVRRYAHLAPATLRQHAEVVSNLLCGTNTAQPGNEKGLALPLTP